MLAILSVGCVSVDCSTKNPVALEGLDPDSLSVEPARGEVVMGKTVIVQSGQGDGCVLEREFGFRARRSLPKGKLPKVDPVLDIWEENKARIPLVIPVALADFREETTGPKAKVLVSEG